MNHLSPPPSPQSKPPSLNNFNNPALDMNLTNSKNWIQRASTFNSVMATAAAQKLNNRGKFKKKKPRGSFILSFEYLGIFGSL